MSSAPEDEVARLVVRERQSRDRGWFEEMADCYADSAQVEMSWFHGSSQAFIERSRIMDVGGSAGVHRLSPPAVRVQGDRATVELPIVIEFRTAVGGVPADLLSFARSQYRAVRQDGTWSLTRLTAVYERDTLTAAIPGQHLGLDSHVFDGLRPSYRCLAWHMHANGYSVPDDLPGDDRPEGVRQVMAEERRWLFDQTMG